MRGLGTDLRHAVRLATKSPGFTAVAVLTLALGVGGTTAVFGLLDALLLRPLPYPEPDRLMVPKLTRQNGAEPVQEIPVWSWPKFQTFVASQDIFESVAGVRDWEVNLSAGDVPRRVQGELVTPSYFEVLGVRPAVGPGFDETAVTSEGASVAIVGDRLWRELLGADPAAVGRTVRVGDRTLTVVGVAPRGFRGLTGSAELWAPMALAPQVLHPEMLQMRWAHWFEVVGRARPGLDRAAAAARMSALGAIVDAAHPPPKGGEQWGATVRTLVESRQDPKMRTSVAVLFGAVTLVLLLGCVNVAHLLLARAAARRHELAVRAAMGATRGRLVRQLLTESLLLGLLAGALGLLLAGWGIELLAAIRPEAFARIGLDAAELKDLDRLELSPGIAAFAVALSVLAGLLFGAIPALSASRVDLAARIEEGATRATPRRRGLFAATELALALVLLVGAALLGRTLERVTSVDLGFDASDVLAFEIAPPRPGPDRPWPRREELLERLAALPGVESVAFGACAPPQDHCDLAGVFQVEGKERFPDGSEPLIGVHYVSPGYFRTLGVPVLRGRGFEPADRQGAPEVMIINAAAARALFGDADPVGRGLHVSYGSEKLVPIVGVVGDVRYDGAVEPARPALYLPMLQFHHASGHWFVRSRVDTGAMVAAVRALMADLDPTVPIFGAGALADRVRDATAGPRFAAVLLGGFAGIALLLAALGVYGVMAQSVALRRREIGIRMALGARRPEVMMMLLRQGAAIALGGIAVGLGLAFAASRVLAGLLFGVTATDAPTYAGVAILLFAVALVACAAAGRRAVTIDPAETLREA